MTGTEVEIKAKKPGMKTVVDKFSALAKVEGTYFLCRQENMNEVAENLEDLSLPISDKFLFCVAPANTTDKNAMKLLRQYAERKSEEKAFSLNMKIPYEAPKTFEELGQLCNKHNYIDLYLWLSQRFEGNNGSSGIETRIAMQQKRLLLKMITDALSEEDGKLELAHNYEYNDSRARWKFRQSQRKKKGQQAQDRGYKGSKVQRPRQRERKIEESPESAHRKNSRRTIRSSERQGRRTSRRVQRN